MLLRVLPLVLLLSASACATAAAGGSAQGDCQSCVPAGSRAGVRFQRDALIPAGDTTSVLTVSFQDGRRMRQTRSTEWSGEARNQWGPYFETEPGDSLRATAVLQSASGDTLATGRIALAQQPGWWWGVRWDVARVSEIRGQPGSAPGQALGVFPLRQDAGQADPRALYVRVGNRAIASPTPR